MQYPVPQFTDVEDKIIANLTLRQFGILFGAGVIIFLFFSATKNIFGTIAVFLLVGLPAIIVAFVRINGRPLYKTLGHLIVFFTHPRQMLFHKQGIDAPSVYTFKPMESSEQSKAPVPARPSIKDLSAQLQKQREQEAQLIKTPR